MVTVDEPEFKVARMNISESRDERTSFFRLHYVVGTSAGVTHFTEDHTLGLFTREETLRAFSAAGLAAEYDEHGIFGRGLYVARRAA